jgi:AcrR family transcriptional regulator
MVKRPRGRPRGFIAEEVLERVRTVFMEKGFAAASLDDLAAASGLNRPSLYAAFGDKEQLYITTLRFYGQKSLEGLDAILAGQGQSRSAWAGSTTRRSSSTPRHRCAPAA